MTTRRLFTEAEVRHIGRGHGLDPELICRQCGRVAYAVEHFGHAVIRIKPEPAPAPPPPPRPTFEWLMVRELAAELAVSKMTVYRLIHDGTLPAVRVGRSMRVRRDHFEAYLHGAVVEAGDLAAAVEAHLLGEPA